MYAGAEDAALYKSADGGVTWSELTGLRTHPSAPDLAAGRGRAVPAHDHPAGAADLSSRSPRRARFRSDDCGQTWRPINRGLHSEGIPDEDAEVGHCVHHVEAHPTRPDTLFMQKHWDVMRSDDGGVIWTEVSGNLPTDFGFPIAVHPHEPETIYVVPITSDSLHYPPDGQLRVWRSRSGGERVGAADERAAAAGLLRERVPGRDGDGHAGRGRDLLRHHRAGRYTSPPTPGTRGRRSCVTCPPCCRSRSRSCRDTGRGPRRAARAPAEPGEESTARSWCACRGPLTQRAVLDALEARFPMLRGTIRDRRTGQAAGVHPVLRVRAGPVQRAAGRAAAGRRWRRRSRRARSRSSSWGRWPADNLPV